MDNRVCYRVCYRIASRHQDIVVYLKSPRRRRENFLFTKRIAQDIVVYLKSPRRRREKILFTKRIAQDIVVYLKSPRRRREKQSVYWRNAMSGGQYSPALGSLA